MGERGRASVDLEPGGRLDLGHDNGNNGGGPRQQTWGQKDALDRERLVSSHLPLVHRLCRRFRDCGEPPEDLVQVGSIGLLKASKKYDPERGISFITYAVPVIVGEIKNYLRDHGWAVKVPRKIQKQKLAVQRAVEALGHRLGRSPTVDEIAEATELSQEEVFDTFEIGNYGRPLSLYAEYDMNGSRDASTILDFVGSEDPQFEQLGDRLDLTNTLGCLSKREKTIIYLKFYRDLPQTEIAKRLGISQMHVSRLQRAALGKLKEAMVQ